MFTFEYFVGIEKKKEYKIESFKHKDLFHFFNYVETITIITPYNFKSKIISIYDPDSIPEYFDSELVISINYKLKPCRDRKTIIIKEIPDFKMEDIRILIQNYTFYISEISNLNKKLKNKQIRNPNFPSEISENIVRILIEKVENKVVTWDTKSGDIGYGVKTFEIKCFSSAGPISFGPKEKWDTLYILDATQLKMNKYKCYKINLTNKDQLWRIIKVSKKETFGIQCDQKRRPRITFKKLIEENKELLELIFDGTIK